MYIFFFCEIALEKNTYTYILYTQISMTKTVSNMTVELQPVPITLQLIVNQYFSLLTSIGS